MDIYWSADSKNICIHVWCIYQKENILIYWGKISLKICKERKEKREKEMWKRQSFKKMSIIVSSMLVICQQDLKPFTSLNNMCFNLHLHCTLGKQIHVYLYDYTWFYILFYLFVILYILSININNMTDLKLYVKVKL